MESLQTTATRSLRALLEHQPMSAAKATFAWRIAAGPTLGRAADVSWNETTHRLHLAARTAEWQRELRRARPVMLQRMQELLGEDAIGGIEIT